MKHLSTVFILAMLISLSACKSYEVKSIHYLSSVKTAQLIERNDVVTVIDMNDIRPFLLRATWHSTKPMNKGTHHLSINGNSDLYISYYGGFFWVEDRPGFFELTPDDRELFDQYFNQLMNDKVFPWRQMKNNSEPAV